MCPSARLRCFFQEAFYAPRVCLGVGSLCVRVMLQADASVTKRAEQSSKADAAEVIHSQVRSSDTSDEGKQTSHMTSSFSLEKPIT